MSGALRMSVDFLLISLIVVVTPGTGMIYTLVCSLSRGWRGTFFGALGSTLSIVPHIAAAVFGLAAVLHASATAFQLVKYAGVAYLLFMAWKVLKEGMNVKVEGRVDNRSHLKVVMHGILASLLNPKLSIFFLAFLPQFINVGAVDPVSQMIGLGAVFMVMTFAVFIAVGSVAVLVRDKVISRPNIMTWLSRVFAASFVALGAKLALTER